jgi:hypothetical protein
MKPHPKGDPLGYDAYLELERALQRITTLDFEKLGEMPGPLYDLADDLQAVLGPEEAGRLAGFLNERIDDYSDAASDAASVDEWEGQR